MLHRNHTKNLTSRELVELNNEKNLCVYLKELVSSKKNSDNILINTDLKRIIKVNDYTTYRKLTAPKFRSLYCSGEIVKYTGYNIYEEFFKTGKISELDIGLLGTINTQKDHHQHSRNTQN